MTQPDVAPTAGDTPEELAAAQALEFPGKQPLPAEPEPAATEEVSSEAIDPPAVTAPIDSQPVSLPAPSALVLVSVDQPFYQRTYVDGKLTIDRFGVLVPEGDVASLVESAAAHGIGLKVGKS